MACARVQCEWRGKQGRQGRPTRNRNRRRRQQRAERSAVVHETQSCGQSCTCSPPRPSSAWSPPSFLPSPSTHRLHDAVLHVANGIALGGACQQQRCVSLWLGVGHKLRLACSYRVADARFHLLCVFLAPSQRSACLPHRRPHCLCPLPLLRASRPCVG